MAALPIVCVPRSTLAAGDVNAVAGASIASSTGNGWEGDGAIPSAQLRLAYRFPVGIAPVFVGREGYARVDDRLLTLISLGVQGWLDLGGAKPYARLAWAHQHEESTAFAREEPFGVLFGVGRGIRHRGGIDMALGADVPLARSKSLTWLVVAELWADWMFASESPGPEWYLGGTLGIGVDWSL